MNGQVQNIPWEDYDYNWISSAPSHQGSGSESRTEFCSAQESDTERDTNKLIDWNDNNKCKYLTILYITYMYNILYLVNLFVHMRVCMCIFVCVYYHIYSKHSDNLGKQCRPRSDATERGV